MAKIEITKTELVWPGKYNEDGTRKEVPLVSLPFQVIESINTSRATREAEKKRQPTLFDIYEGKEGDTFEEGWKNKLIWGDNLLVMGSLLEKFAGKIDLIYIDPPFATGADFSFTASVGEEGMELSKEQSIIEEKAYRDTWGQGLDSYIEMIYFRTLLMRDLLNEKGSIYVHLDSHVVHSVKGILDDIFGAENFQAEIIWKRATKLTNLKNYGIEHDTILFYSKGPNFTYNQQYKSLKEQDVLSKYIYLQLSDGKITTLSKQQRLGLIPSPKGRRFRGVPLTNMNPNRPNLKYEFRGITKVWATTKERMLELEKMEKIFQPTHDSLPMKIQYLDEVEGAKCNDVWEDIPPVNSQALERTGYSTQKPETLLERMINTSSSEGNLIADFFCGSGTLLSVSERNNRRWIGCDLGRYAIHISRKRLLGIEGCRPFEILNLGKYERQYWQGVTFAGKGKGITEQALYEYLAFILKLYGAQPVAGLAQLHGKKGKAMVHIGAVDAPVTIDEINSAIAECVQLKQGELHILGWEWEMGLYDLMVAEAKKQGVKLLLLQIPREVMEQQAVDKGDIKFFELAYLEVEINTKKGARQAAPATTVTLKDFVIPNTELIPEEVRSKVKKWLDYIDYWAVDWNFQNDTFMQGWVTYRTRKDRTLALTSDPQTYEKTGKYKILVKVVDIFGNDTSQAFEIEVG